MPTTKDILNQLKVNAPTVYAYYLPKKIAALHKDLDGLREQYKTATPQDRQMILAMAEDIKNWISELQSGVGVQIELDRTKNEVRA
jgi:hypothetical protein